MAKYYKYLVPECEGQYHLDVVTSKIPTLNMPVDEALRGATQGLGQVVSIPVYENRYTNFLLNKLNSSLVLSPDSKFSFHWQSKRVVRELERTPDLIYSRSFPASSAMMALKLKRHYNVPWVMHLSDPWADCPVNVLPPKVYEKVSAMERQVFEGADVLSFTSKQTMEFYQNKYSDLDKDYQFFPNVYDPEDVGEWQYNPPRDRRIKIVHTGGLHDSRSPRPFLEALSALPADVQDRFEVCFAGFVDRANQRVMREYDLPCFTYMGSLPSYRDAIRLQREADVLLLIDFPVANPDLRVFFLSKLLDYQITRKPIMAITDAGSECMNFVEERGGIGLDRTDIGGITKALSGLAEAGDEFFGERPINEEYDAKYNAGRLKNLFDRLT